MSRLLIFSDLHVSEKSLAITTKILRHIGEEAKTLGAEIAFLGDFYHVRGLMPVHVQNAVLDELDRWHAMGLQSIMIPGNHDQIDVQGRHALEALATHPAVTIYSAPMADRWGVWIPYQPELGKARELVRGAAALSSRIFWHGPILGATMNNSVVSDHGLTAEDFTGSQAFLGHFHGRQWFGSAVYVGSPWETKADEAGQPKGFVVLEADGQWQYHDREWGPRHRRATAETIEDLTAALANAKPEDVVQVHVPEALVAEAAELLAGRFADAIVTPSAVEVSTRALSAQGVRTWREHACEYARTKSPDDLEPLIASFDAITESR